MNCGKPHQLLVCFLLALLLLASCVRSQPVTTSPTQISESPASTSQGRTLIVNSTVDNGLGTLRQALLDAKSGDTITFDPNVFPPEAPVTITLLSGLPTIAQGNLVIDASNAGVILDGINIKEASANGLTITSEGNTVRGLQIIQFPSAGIALKGNARNNIIGGDRNMGAGPLGQGNLVSGNKGPGIGIWYEASYNVIQGNYVGTDINGILGWGNASGIHINGGSYNKIYSNLISDNTGYGIELCCTDDTHNNNVSGNYIGTDINGNNTLANQSAGLALHDGAVNNTIGPDNIINTYPQHWIFMKDSSSVDNTFFLKFVDLQEGNSLPKTVIEAKSPKELADNYIKMGGATDWSMRNSPKVLAEIAAFSVKRVGWSLNEAEARSTSSIDWNENEFNISSEPGGPDDYAKGLVQYGITSTYILTFWDKANHPEGWQPFNSRFKTEEELNRYLDYIRFVVRHFKGSIQYYELWNEPDMQPTFLHHIDVEDYINLVKRVVPVIRQEDPAAKIVVGGVVLQVPQSREYLLNILRSDIMSLVDVVSWHSMFGVSPEYMSEYYYECPAIIQEIKDVAAANGFRGEYRGEELNWQSSDCFWGDRSTGQPVFSNIVAAKYYARGIVMHLGMGLTTGVSDMSSLRMESFITIRNLCTILSGSKPLDISLNMQSTATNIRTYDFSMPDGSRLVALWTDGVAVDDDPGVKSTVRIQNVSAKKVIGIDVLNGFEQPLNVNIEGSNLVIPDLLIKDYPIFLRLIP